MAIEGKVNEVVITYKDRLARFGYDLIEQLIETYSNGKIKIINKKEEETPEDSFIENCFAIFYKRILSKKNCFTIFLKRDEITKDILSIMNVYVAKINGRRKGTNK